MAPERDLKELQDRRDRRRQDDHLNREREKNDLHHKIKEVQELLEKLRKELAEKDIQLAENDIQLAENDIQLADNDKVIEQLKSQKIPSTPPHHSSLTSDGKAFDGQSCTPRAAG
jgi:DNA repair exonuclease SbcCD ATPase subunit